MVYWLIVCIGTCAGATVVPVPYDTIEGCQYAGKHVRYAECIPQAMGNLDNWGSVITNHDYPRPEHN